MFLTILIATLIITLPGCQNAENAFSDFFSMLFYGGQFGICTGGYGAVGKLSD